VETTINGDFKSLNLKCATAQLPYELGEMPAIFSSLSPYDPVVFLESREGTEKYARYGIVAARPLVEVVGRGSCFAVRDNNGKSAQWTVDNPLELLKTLAPAVHLPEVLETFRFAAGWVGSLGYECCGLFEGIPRAGKDDLSLPDSVFYLPSILVLKDASKRRLMLVCHDEDEKTARGLCEKVSAYLKDRSVPSPPAADNFERKAESSFPEKDFLKTVTESKRLIHEGELIQVVVSRRWEIKPAPKPETVYGALAALNPSPYHFFIRMPGGVLLGASPELLVRRENDTLTVRPIAGTRPRGGDMNEDRALEMEMMKDPKERAEHTMLVDLGRNDLGRVSKPGSVRVTRRMLVEKYSHVMHLVSEVRSRIMDGFDSYDVVRFCFPAGTVSGAPKIRAMQAISEMEPVIRGPYAGGVGYFDVRGNMDFCITIRSIFYSGERAFVQSGAGIVADSVPERELGEIAAKAAAMFRAFGNVRLKEGGSQ